MEDLFWLLFIVIFFVAPILERVLKGGAGQRPPGRRPLPGPSPRRSLPGQPQRRPSPGEPTQGRTPAKGPPPTANQHLPGMPAPVDQRPGAGGENSVDILPADLWAILTGQKPFPTEPSRPAPAPAPAEPVLEAELEDVAAEVPTEYRRDEQAEVDQLRRRRERETIESRTVRHAPPEVVSLESTLLSEPRRHAAFHRKLETAPALEVEVAGEGPALRIDSMGRSELQRAVLLQEILGTPKGLE